MASSSSLTPPPSAPSAPTAGSGRGLPWVEKYRPRTLSAVSHQPEIIATLSRVVSSSAAAADLPHLLLYGPPGTGKTSTALALVRDLWGPPTAGSPQRVLELNASDERGIGVVRNKIKRFASLAVAKQPGGSKYPCPAYKIIILDEADALTKDAQSALRRIIESATRVTRFILICNYVSRIIEPLASRCAKFRFRPLPDEVVRERLIKICAEEGAHLGGGGGGSDEMEDGDRMEEDVGGAGEDGETVLNAILEVSGGDLRRAVMAIQSAAAIAPRNGPGGAPAISSDEVYEASYRPDPKWVARLATAVKGGMFDEVERAVSDVTAEGYPVDVLLRALTEEFIGDDSLADVHKAAICMRIAECDKALVDGADEYLQLLDVCCTAQRCRMGTVAS